MYILRVAHAVTVDYGAGEKPRRLVFTSSIDSNVMATQKSFCVGIGGFARMKKALLSVDA